MDKIKEKRFKEPSSYYKNFILYILFMGFMLWIGIHLGFFSTEEEIYNHTLNRKLIGDAHQRFAISIEKFLVQNYGKVGIMLVPILGFLSGLYFLGKEVAEYIRYKRKCKLYHEGIIKNIYDIYDDHVPLLSWHRIKTFFKKKEEKPQIKYPAKREMKKRVKEMKKYNKT